MKLLVLSIAVISLAPAFASCRRSEGATNTNSGGRSPDRIESTARPKSCVNLNTATAEELVRLPGIGDVIAKRIIDYREQQGRFRRPEEIIIIQGLSEKKYRAIAGMVCVE
jgi:competence ComEA-like helix-hairpin-helix protein